MCWGIVEERGDRSCELSLLSEAEREQIVVEWNETEDSRKSGAFTNCLRSRWSGPRSGSR